MEIVTTITVPASTPVRLTTKEHVRGDLNITSGADDVFVDRLIDSQSEQVIRYCGRTFAVETIQDVIYLDRWRWNHQRTGGELQLTRWPITAITSVTETASDGTNTVLVQNTDYARRDIYGQLLRLNSDSLLPCHWVAPKITVVYQAGYTLPAQTKTGESYTLPRSLEDAVIRMVKSRYLERGRDPLVKAENIPGVIDRQYWVDVKADGNIPPDIREVLDQFRVPVIG